MEPHVPPLVQVVEALDAYLALYAEAADLHGLLPPDVRARANRQPDPPAEVRTLLAPLALLSDHTRATITANLATARTTILLAERRIADLEDEVALLRLRLEDAVDVLRSNGRAEPPERAEAPPRRDGRGGDDRVDGRGDGAG